VMSKLHWSTVQINCSPLYFYWQTIACKFSDHGWYFQGGHGMAHPDFFQGGWLPTLPPTCRRPWSQPSEIGCLLHFHTRCGRSANLECMSETCCTLGIGPHSILFVHGLALTISDCCWPLNQYDALEQLCCYISEFRFCVQCYIQ